MYDFILDVGHTLFKNGLTLSSLGAVLFLLLKNRRLKRYINAHLPKILRDQEDERTKRIERKLDALLVHEGVEVVCGNTGTSSNTEAQNCAKLSLLSRAVKSRQFRRRMKRMREYLKKLGSRKFQSFVIGFASQVFILLKVDAAPYVDAIAAGGLVVTTIVYIWVEGSTDKANLKGATENDNLDVPIDTHL